MLSIPIINALSNAAAREDYLALLRRAGCARVFLALGDHYGREPETTRELDLLKENIAFYTRAGLEVAVWMDGIGHGIPLVGGLGGRHADFRLNTGLGNGGQSGDSFCPDDEAFVAMYTRQLCRVASCGARMIMIDDDLRMAMHGACVIGCACEEHVRRFNALAREAGLIGSDTVLSREDIAARVFSGKPDRFREIWMRMTGDSLRAFCKKLRDALDTVDPTIRLGHCACLSTWDLDGTDNIELSRILAGKTRPFLRTIGAAYWNNSHAFRTTGLGSIIDLERMQLAWCRKFAPDIEVFTEGDLYPRPRYVTPHMYAEDFDQALLCSGENDGILKYMLCYEHTPDYETGYIDRHEYFAPLREELREVFSPLAGAGIYVHERMHKAMLADYTSISETEISFRFTPASVNFVSLLSLPVTFTLNKYAACALVFGDSAHDISEIPQDLPLILDAPSAKLLTQRGIDCGIREDMGEITHTLERFTANTTVREHRVSGSGKCRRFALAEGCCVLSAFEDGSPAVWVYKNADGRRFLVYAWDMEGCEQNSEFIRSYSRQEQLREGLKRIGVTLPAHTEKQCGMYLLVKRSEERLACGMWNFSDDIALPFSVTLEHVPKHVHGIGGTNVTVSGNVVTVEQTVMPYGFAGFAADF